MNNQNFHFILEILFFFCVFLILYTYLFYHLIVRFFSRNKTQNKIIYENENDLPFVSILIAAHNEEVIICEKILSIFNNNYPKDKIEVIVGSDCSTDKTNQLVLELAVNFSNLHLIEFKIRSGKIKIINQLVEKTKNDLIIMTDANVLFAKETIFELLKHFKNKRIGLVDSKMQNIGIKKDGISFQEKTYISSEVSVKYGESLLWGAMMGPFGGCFAFRKNLWGEIPAHFLVDDFYINMLILKKGFKSINEPSALVYEDVSNNLKDEFNRKIRISTGNFQNLFHFKHLLFDFSWVAFAFFSHKVVRWFVPFFILIILIILPFLVVKGNFYYYFLFGIFICFILLIGDVLLKLVKINIASLRFLTHFTLMNCALFFGFLKYMKGVKSSVWEPTKRNQ